MLRLKCKILNQCIKTYNCCLIYKINNETSRCHETVNLICIYMPADRLNCDCNLLIGWPAELEPETDTFADTLPHVSNCQLTSRHTTDQRTAVMYHFKTIDLKRKTIDTTMALNHKPHHNYYCIVHPSRVTQKLMCDTLSHRLLSEFYQCDCNIDMYTIQ